MYVSWRPRARRLLPWVWLALASLIALGCGASSSTDADAGDASPTGANAGAATAEAQTSAGPVYSWPESAQLSATLVVADHGEIVIELYPDLAPETVANFAKLAREGFYDGTTFHRVIPGFMIQGGDPLSRDDNLNNDGQGGPDYRIDDEINGAPHLPGTVSMANDGRPDTGGSQFFIVTGDARQLDTKHTVFGRVRSGSDVVDSISRVETDRFGRWGPAMRPLENVVVERVTISESGDLAGGG